MSESHRSRGRTRIAAVCVTAAAVVALAGCGAIGGLTGKGSTPTPTPTAATPSATSPSNPPGQSNTPPDTQPTGQSTGQQTGQQTGRPTAPQTSPTATVTATVTQPNPTTPPSVTGSQRAISVYRPDSSQFQYVSFASPSARIQCTIAYFATGGQLLCVLPQGPVRSTLPSATSACADADAARNGLDSVLVDNSSVQWFCGGDLHVAPVAIAGNPQVTWNNVAHFPLTPKGSYERDDVELPYGHAVDFAGIRCTSLTTGITCSSVLGAGHPVTLTINSHEVKATGVPSIARQTVTTVDYERGN